MKAPTRSSGRPRHARRYRRGEPARRTLHTGAYLLTDKQKDLLLALLAADEHVQVEATWAIYQQMIAAYRQPDRTRGRALIHRQITARVRRLQTPTTPSIVKSCQKAP